MTKHVRRVAEAQPVSPSIKTLKYGSSLRQHKRSPSLVTFGPQTKQPLATTQLDTPKQNQPLHRRLKSFRSASNEEHNGAISGKEHGKDSPQVIMFTGTSNKIDKDNSASKSSSVVSSSRKKAMNDSSVDRSYMTLQNNG